jgi:hypothetical protein
MEVESYEDPILKLIQDPNLNHDRAKTAQLNNIINSFGLTERRISKLCQTSLSILQTLEKINLKFRSWEFMSLDFNSDNHFNESNQIKSFNNLLADKIITTCNELQLKVQKISYDLDYLTKSSKNLSPMEYISDSGTLFTSILLRAIKLKNEVVESLTVSYSKAKLMIIGKELESMLEFDQDSTLSSYKTFIISLMKQLNSSIEQQDSESKYECLAVISDMESMFEAFKLEKIKESTLKIYQKQQSTETDQHQVSGGEPLDIAIYKQMEEQEEPNKSAKFNTVKPIAIPRKTNHSNTSPQTNQSTIFDGDVDDHSMDSEYGSSSIYGSAMTQPPIIHSITKLDENTRKRLDSITSMSTNQLYKTTLSDELPYLMSAFSSTKVIAEDLSHYQAEDENVSAKSKSLNNEQHTKSTSNLNDKKKKPIFTHKTNLPNSPLYNESTILSQTLLPPESPSIPYFDNTSFLSKLGIRPQVIQTNYTHKDLIDSNKDGNKICEKKMSSSNKHLLKNIEENIEEKENKGLLTPLTKENLESYTWSRAETIALHDLVD